MNEEGLLKLILQITGIGAGFFLASFLIYLFTRLVSSGVFRSYFETKKMFEKGKKNEEK